MGVCGKCCIPVSVPETLHTVWRCSVSGPAREIHLGPDCGLYLREVVYVPDPIIQVWMVPTASHTAQTQALCSQLGHLSMRFSGSWGNEQKALAINTETSPVGGLQLSWLPQGCREKP